MKADICRCDWALKSEIECRYHDFEWGAPQHGDRKLFEFLILEGAQAGLSWRTVLNKRDRYREAFDGFDPEIVARYGEAKLALLETDAGLIRNRLKIRSAVTNAQRFLDVQAEFGSFDAYLWRFVDGQPIRNQRRQMSDLPATSAESDALSKDLRKRGFNFVGSTICYALMQAIGMVNDHLVDCFRWQELDSGGP